MIDFSLAHVERMTDTIGILEHCNLSTPNRIEGHSLDDNARALQVVHRLDKASSEEFIKKYSSLYLQFLLFARTPQGFHQDLNTDLSWKDDAGVEEGFGRAMVALGEDATTAPLFDEQAFLISTIRFPKVMAHIIIAISKRTKLRKKIKCLSVEGESLDLKKELIVLSDKLIKEYQKHSCVSWKWYEDRITYDNGRIPLSLFCAFQETKNKKYLEVAKESLDFLITQTYDQSKNYFSFVGNKGWYQKGKKPAVFDQQPIEAGSMVEVCVKAYEVLKDIHYLHYARTALLWYSGKNILGCSLIDAATGGVYDGLQSHGVNQNEGAESILSYILACLALKEIE